MKSKKSNFSQSFSQAIHSIRTRNAIVTSVFLFLFLGMFYIGGRLVLSNLVRDTANQVRDAGHFVTSCIQHQTDTLRTAVEKALSAPQMAAAPTRAFLSETGSPFSFVARFEPDGVFREGSIYTPVALQPLTAESFAAYEKVLCDWAAVASRASKSGDAATFEIGILRVGGSLHYAAFTRRGDDLLLFGRPFNADSFVRANGEESRHLQVSLGESSNAAMERKNVRTTEASSAEPTLARSRAGISPMFTEMESADDAPSFWGFRSGPMETVFVLRDISGNAISELSISLPKAFSSATRMAIWQLAFYVALGGILFVLPIFWMQSRILLNPLTRMTQAISALGARDTGLECPRVEWTGKDEFALLAESVNRMVERIASKTVALASVESRHQALISGVPDALATFNAHGELVFITKQPEGVAPLVGLTPGAGISAEVFGEAAAKEFRATVQTTFRTRTLGVVRLTAKAQEGREERNFEVRLTRMGEFFILAIIRDVTEEVAEHERRLAAEEHSLDASKRESLTGFAAGIAHDMNNVLSVVLNTVDASAANPNDDKMRAVSTIRDSVRRGIAMMRELTTFAGENRMTLMRTDPKVVLDDVRQIAVRTVGKNIEVTFETEGPLPDVDVDLNQFWKVIFNIVKNAGEAIGSRPGHISLKVYPFKMTRTVAANVLSEGTLPEGDGVVFEIKDDGPGIPEDFLKRIFDPYVSSKGLGRGLGLATVRTVIEAHGGGLRVKSRPDEGTTFSIFLPASKLPLAERAGVVPKDAEAAPAGEEADGVGDILIVDDDPAILKTTQILCKALKLNAHVAIDRREALLDVRRNASRLQAIVLDAHLGSFDTVRLLGAFRLSAPHVPVIVASGSSEEMVQKMFRPHPYDAFLAKPYTLNEFRTAIRAARRSAV